MGHAATINTFFGAAALQGLIVDAIANAPAGMAPLDTVAAALEAVAPGFEERRAFARQRHALIVAHAELQEREVMKLTSLAAAAAAALRRRGVAEPAASLTAEAGISVFKIAFEQWIGDAERRGLAHHIRQSVRALQTAIVGGAATASRTKEPARGTSTRSRQPRK